MWMQFTVEGDPFGWQRAGQNRFTGATFTQKKTREREQLVAWAFRRHCGRVMFPAGAFVDMEILAYMRIPKSATKAKRLQMLSGEIRPTVKPDWDNIGKLIADALNGVAYDDDKCIVDARVRKFYSDRPRTVVILKDAGLEGDDP